MKKIIFVYGMSILFLLISWDNSKALTQESVETARKELAELKELMIQAGLVKDFDHFESDRVIYVRKPWYQQEVKFKENLLYKLASLKKALTGSHRFEVRDAFSNEKVAEVTAFSGAVEIYK